MSASQTLKPIAHAVATSTEDAPVVATSQGDEQAMARYRITSPVLVGRVRYRAGAKIDYDGVPGTCMQPLNAAGRAAKLAAVLADEAASQRTAGLASGAVVPARLGGNHMHRIKLAKSLGAGELANYAAYDAFISNWIAEQQAAQEA
jgi:hypothetical protein